MPYQNPYTTAYDSAFKQTAHQAQLREQMRQRQATEILRRQQMQQQAEHYRAQELLARDRLTADAARRMQAAQEQGGRDTEANRIANTLNPPAAVAVTPPGGDPAWTHRADALRDRWFAQNPTVAPGPQQPFTGGAKMLPTIRPTLPKAPGTDMVAQHQQHRDQTAAQADLDKLRAQIGKYLVDPDSVTGLDAFNPATGEHGYLGPMGATDTAKFPPARMNIARGSRSEQIALDPKANISALMDNYLRYRDKKAALSAPAPAGASAAPSAAPSVAPGPPPSDPPTVASMDEAKALPSGTVFIDPSGQKRRVP